MTIKCKRCKSDAKIISSSQNFWKMCLYSIICAVIFLFIPVISSYYTPSLFIKITIYLNNTRFFYKLHIQIQNI